MQRLIELGHEIIIGGPSTAQIEEEVEVLLPQTPQVFECDKVTGEDCSFARLHVRSISQLDEILGRIADKSETQTAIVKSQPFAGVCCRWNEIGRADGYSRKSIAAEKEARERNRWIAV